MMDMKRAELPLLISLDALLGELNVTRAARRLSISQSALSGQLARLRLLFGDPLLVPSENGRGMVPTERALALRPRLNEALAQLRDAVAEQPVFDPTSSHRTFVVAANDSVFSIVGVSVLAEVVQAAHPNLRIAIVPSSDGDLMERMARGEVDLLLGDAKKMPESLKARVLLRDSFRMAQRRGHPRGLGVPTLDEYCAQSHVLVSHRADFHSPIDDVLAQLSRRRRVAVTVPSYNQVALVLSQTDCVATLPQRLLQRYEHLVDIIDLPYDILPFDFAMAWHPRAQQDASSAWLRQCFVAAC